MTLNLMAIVSLCIAPSTDVAYFRIDCRLMSVFTEATCSLYRQKLCLPIEIKSVRIEITFRFFKL